MGQEEEVPLPRVRLTAGCSLCAGVGSHCCGAQTPLFGCGHTYSHFWVRRSLSPKGLEGANFGVWLHHGLDFPNPLPFLLFLPTAPASFCPPLHCTSTHATLNLRKTPGPLCKWPLLPSHWLPRLNILAVEGGKCVKGWKERRSGFTCLASLSQLEAEKRWHVNQKWLLFLEKCFFHINSQDTSLLIICWAYLLVAYKFFDHAYLIFKPQTLNTFAMSCGSKVCWHDSQTTRAKVRVKWQQTWVSHSLTHLSPKTFLGNRN